MRNTFAILLALAVSIGAAAQEKIRVACVGNSVTYGYKLPERETNCYPNRLQEMLGAGYEVGNFGHSGATLMRNGHNPYHKLPEYEGAVRFLREHAEAGTEDIVVIHLGLNDTDPRNYAQRGEEFAADYHALIDSMRAASPRAHIYICKMTPIFHGHSRYLSGTRDWHRDIQGEIERVAKSAGVGLIDLFTPLHCRPDLFPDNLHPDPEGARILARTVYGAITRHASTPLALQSVWQKGAVMQREAANTISGTAPDSLEVTVRFNGAEVTTVAADGKWAVTLPAMAAGGPYRMEVTGKKRGAAPTMGKKSGGKHLGNRNRGIVGDKGLRTLTLAVDSIYVGEVWLCSGQSNMEWVCERVPKEFRPEICLTGKTDATDSLLHLYRMEGATDISTGRAWGDSLMAETNALRYVQEARWQTPSRGSVNRFSAIAYRTGRALADSLGCHIGLIVNAIGGSGIEAWIDRTTTEWETPELLMVAQPRYNDFLQDWVRRCINDNLANATNPLQRHPFEPCYLYETSIAPLEGLTLRGVMWYQGESNAHNCEMYARQWPLMVRQWRSVFSSADGGDLPFYTMQLAAISGRPSWGRFRDLQRRLADADPRTYLVVTHDVGEEWNVHPGRKDIQAARLAQTILKGDTSPVCTAATEREGEVTLTFSEALSGEAAEFELCGDDGLYHPATATVSGNTVTLRSDRVARPVETRYAWKDFTRASLRGSRTSLLVSSFKMAVGR